MTRHSVLFASPARGRGAALAAALLCAAPVSAASAQPAAPAAAQPSSPPSAPAPSNTVAKAPSGKPLSMAEAIQTALARSPELAIADKGTESAEARVKSAKARRWPALNVEAQAIFWNEELAFGLSPMPMPGDPQVVVRERITTSASATLTLPLSHQILIGKLVAVDRNGLEAAQHDTRAQRLAVATNAARAYLGVLLAERTRDIAESRTALVAAQLERAKVLESSGVLGRVDVMRLEAALAAVRRQAINAAADAASAEDGLTFILGLPVGTDVAVRDDLPESGGPPPLVPAAAAAAAEGRPEIAAARARAAQAEAGAEVEKSGLLPGLVALGTLQFSQGNGEFQPESAWFLGLSLSWNLWDWGSTWNRYKAASYQAEQATLAANRQADGLKVEARRAARAALAAFEALDVAKVGLAAAEEAFRIQEVRFAEGATTTTELLAAETEVTEARLGFATARIAYYAQLAALAQASGQRPDALIWPQGQSAPGTP